MLNSAWTNEVMEIDSESSGSWFQERGFWRQYGAVGISWPRISNILDIERIVDVIASKIHVNNDRVEIKQLTLNLAN